MSIKNINYSNLPVGTTANTLAAGNDSRIVTSTANALAIAALTLNPTSVQLTSYSANAQDLVLCDTSTAAFAVTLPSSPSDKTLIEVKKLDSSSNILTVQTSGSDTFLTGGTITQLALQGQAVTFRYSANMAKWISVSNDLPYAATEARYLTQSTASANYATLASPAFTGTPTAPTATSSDSSTKLATTAFVANSSITAPIGVGKGIKACSQAATNFNVNISTSVPLDSAAFIDDAAYYSLSSGVITIKKSGLYTISFYASVTLSSAGSFTIFPRINSGTTIQEAGTYTVASTVTRIAGAAVYRLSANDTLGLWVYGYSAGTVSGTSNPKDVGISVAFMGS